MNKKRLPLIIFILLLTFTFALPVSAETLNKNEIESLLLPINDPISNEVEPFVSGSGYNYTKENVKITYYWSNPIRVSDNLNTYGSSGGSISSDREKSFGVNVSGSYKNLGFDINYTIQNRIGYKYDVGPNRRVYMAWKVRYKVETGTRVQSSTITGTVFSRKPYRVETPTYGEFLLINY